jgi:hypothetical protein
LHHVFVFLAIAIAAFMLGAIAIGAVQFVKLLLLGFVVLFGGAVVWGAVTGVMFDSDTASDRTLE